MFYRAKLAILSGLIAMTCAVDLRAEPGSSTDRGVASASIIKPISVSAQKRLEFGGVAVSANQGGNVTIDPSSGNAAYNGSAKKMCLTAVPCAPGPAVYAVQGEKDRGYRVILPTTVMASAQRGPAPDLVVSQITSASENRPNNDSAGLLNANGRDTLRIGGQLEIPAGTPPGSYAAEITLVVSYE
ncbi:DUF4402 domain-containing protein [Altererythrobacter luteolus]|uniref:DUF4402 domain-containing protein n=1 Tax=Pontixanthobacter luteolus TaxID=295089 RepID=A0A6I4V2D9_9SPHN|nr:DUF4402 domain-containing protein [Pontixanthobacter luteolus]MXP48337.1 DUF4402 domain-containing protein [Pontixanthobacter luteolus]